MKKNNQPKQFSTTPIGAFCSRHKITLAKLHELAGSGSRTAYHRLLCGELDTGFETVLMERLAKVLPNYLVELGLDRAEIDKQLLEIFTRGEYQPMISKRIELNKAEQEFFGLSEDPFSKHPDSKEEVYLTPLLQQIVDRLLDAIHYQGFVSVTGPIGCGKSTLRALIIDQLEKKENIKLIWPEFFDMKMISPMQIAEAILLACQPETKVPRSALRRGKAVQKLLARLYKDGTRVTIAFDEGHRLGDAALSSLKNFLEMSSGGFQRYLGVIIFAQPMLKVRLHEAMFQEIIERIVQIDMPDFSDSARGYLAHRLSLVGADANELFDAEAIDLICSQATTPLQLGNVANEMLRISKSAFNNQRVIGSAIRTKMIFENRHEPQFKRRVA